MNRKKVVGARAALAKSALSILEGAENSVRRQLERLLKGDDIELDLSSLDDLDGASRPFLEGIAGDSTKLVLAQIGFDEEDLFDKAFDAAAVWAKDRSAELVSQVTETTRQRLRKIISDGIAQNIGRDAIIQNILETSLFSEERARLIADTEILMANGAGNLIGFKEAAAAGVVLKKEWDPADEPCPVCLGNAADGQIPVDAVFSSGDETTPAHPNCLCVVVGVTF